MAIEHAQIPAEKGGGGTRDKVTYGPENTYYDIAPQLALEKKNANVSYYYSDGYVERTANIYKDSNGNQWYEVKKSPRKQMAVALLAQPFFNISTIIEIPQKSGVSTFLAKINPRLTPLLKGLLREKSVFLSKQLNLNKVEYKNNDEILIDYLIFCAIFDKGRSDRSLELRHNIRHDNNSYALFDFEGCNLTPLKHHEELARVKGKPLFLEYLNIRSSQITPFGVSAPVSRIDLVPGLVRKLREVRNFFEGETGEKFVKAVLEKTKYAEEYKEEHKKEVKGGTLDISYVDSRELTQGLLAQITYCARVLLEELEKELEELKKYQKHGQETVDSFSHFYPTVILELRELAASSRSKNTA